MGLICIDWVVVSLGSIRGGGSGGGTSAVVVVARHEYRFLALQSFAFLLRQTVRASSFQKRDTFVS